MKYYLEGKDSIKDIVRQVENNMTPLIVYLKLNPEIEWNIIVEYNLGDTRGILNSIEEVEQYINANYEYIKRSLNSRYNLFISLEIVCATVE